MLNERGNFMLNQQQEVTDIQWIPVISDAPWARNAFPEKGLKATVEVKYNAKHNVYNKELTFRIHEGLMREMGWERGDKLLVCYDKNDLLNMMLLKHEKGRTLVKEGDERSKVSRVTFKMDEAPLDAMRSVTQTYRIDKHAKRLFLRLNTSEKAPI